MFRLLCLVIAIFLTSCSINPLSGSNSGHSIGEGNVETHLTVLPVQAAQLAYGVTDNLDVGGLVESGLGLSLDVWLKYALLNEEQGHGLSVFSGAFTSASFVNSTGFYIGSIYSYRMKNFEPYIKFKLSRVYWDTDNLKEEKEKQKEKNKDIIFISDAVLFAIENTDKHFLTYGAGTRLNLSENSYIGLGVLGVRTKDVSSDLSPEISFTFKF